MDNNNSISKAIQILAEILECEPQSLSAEDTIETVDKWDSLNHMRLVLYLEERLNTQLETEDAMTLFTISAIAALLEKHSA
ncbi:acyl carrier protein [Sneathiella aquimaris]|uniref:acyl carrier protein n=1 Tax=Sneathiella aquimaris TaxID=2599305 RepID=UPI00146DDD53|nr:acyl carrier protein [Sneathiella aquimaris]